MGQPIKQVRKQCAASCGDESLSCWVTSKVGVRERGVDESGDLDLEDAHHVDADRSLVDEAVSQGLVPGMLLLADALAEQCAKREDVGVPPFVGKFDNGLPAATASFATNAGWFQ